MPEKKKIGEPYYFAIGPNVYGYGNTAEEAIKNAKAAGVPHSRRGPKVKFRIFGPCLDAHDIGCSLVDGSVRWKTQKALVEEPERENPEHWEDLPEVKWEDREIRVPR